MFADLDIREIGPGRRKRKEFHCRICPGKSYSRRKDYEGHLDGDEHSLNVSLDRLVPREDADIDVPPPIPPAQQLVPAADDVLDGRGVDQGGIEQTPAIPAPALQIVSSLHLPLFSTTTHSFRSR